MTFFIHHRDAIGRHIAKYGTHEPLVTKWLSDHLKTARPGIFVDVGANLGWHAIHAAQSSAIETVVAFEPDTSNADLLSRNCARNGVENIVISNCAIGAKSGTALLHRYKDSNRGRHSLVTDYGYGSHLVPIMDLDTALDVLGLGDRPVTVLKIDVEGYEPAVIKGAARTLERTDAVIMEYSPGLSEDGELSTGEMVARLSDCGFVPMALQTTGQLSRIEPDELRRFEGQLDVVWLRAERPVGEIASLANTTAQTGSLHELAEANKAILKPIG